LLFYVLKNFNVYDEIESAIDSNNIEILLALSFNEC